MDLEEYQDLKEALRDRTKGSKEYRKWASQFKEKDHQIWYGNRRLIYRREMERILRMFHDNPTAAHQNAGVMTKQLTKRYVWPGLHKDVKEYVKTCWECQQRRNQRQNNPKMTIVLTALFNRWGIDIVGPLPLSARKNKYIVVAVDYFSRWSEAKALKIANADSVAKFIYERIICRYETPSVIQTDQGTHFINQVIKQLTDKFKIRHSRSSPYHPQANGLVERFNRTLCEGLAKVCEEITEWDDYIQPVLMAYRIKELQILQTSPYKIVYRKEPVLQMDKLGKEQTIMKRLSEITRQVLRL